MPVGLTTAAIRAAVIADLPNKIRRGLSANAALREIQQEFGRAYNRQTFLRDFRDAKAAFDFRPLLARLSETERIPREYFAPTNRYSENKFQYWVTYTYEDALDQRIKTARFGFSDPHRLSKQEVFERAKGAILRGELGAGTKDPTVGMILSISLEGAWERTSAEVRGKKARHTHFRDEAEGE